MKQLLILSGKGGTGKTTTAGAFLHFSKAEARADCDVDAPNLHLISGRKDPAEETPFYGSELASIDPEKCLGCGKCAGLCRYSAIFPKDGVYEVRPYACEGCGLCAIACPAQAVTMAPDESGTLFLHRNAPTFSTAKLKMGRGNSGKLVTAVKNQMMQAADPKTKLAIIDGSPGIGCPVIASVSGVSLVLIVAEPSMSGISDLKRILKTAAILHTKAAVCINKSTASPEHTREIEDFCRQEAIPLLGKIPYDPTVSQAMNAGKSIAEYDCPARDHLRSVYEQAMELLEETP